MKFARYLEENTVSEWKKVYIQYRGLKKLIKRVTEHRQARIAYELQHGIKQYGSASSASSQSPANGSILRRRGTASSGAQRLTGHPESSLARSDGSVHRVDYGGTGGPQSSASIPPVSLRNTGLQLLHDDLNVFQEHHVSLQLGENDIEAQKMIGTADEQRPGLPLDNIGPTDSGAEPIEPVSPTTLHNSEETTASKHTQSEPHSTESRTVTDSGRRPLGKNGMTGSFGPLRQKKSKHQFPTSLDELIDKYFDDEERKIFSATDVELEKVTSFYAAREIDAAQKYVQLSRQLKELAEHRREYRAKHQAGNLDNQVTKNAKHRLSVIFGGLQSSKVSRHVGNPEAGANGAATPAQEQQNGGQSTLFSQDGSVPDGGPTNNASDGEMNGNDPDEGDKRRTEALAEMQANLKGWDNETDRAIRQANKAAAMSHNPQAYNAARKKLKAAVLEYYKFLETLSNYKILNRTGFAKIMKKLSKTVGVPCADAYYEAHVAPSILVTSKRIESLVKSTEDIYAAYFEHGNRKQALNRLRLREDQTTHHFSVFRSGLYLGVATCATVAGLVEAMKPSTHQSVPQWQGLLRVYGAEFIPTLFGLFFGLNLAWWHSVRINSVFIFEWDIRHTMDHRQFFEIPAFLMLLLSLCFWVSFLNPAPAAIAPTTWPTVWLVILVIVLLNPFPIMLRPSRIWFVRSILRVFSAGYKRVEFRDFFLGDELNSIAWSLSNVWYFGCEWKHNWAVPDQCSPNSTYWTAFLLSVPALLRLGQCIRRWVDSDYRTHLHLVNGLKYMSSVIQFFAYVHWRKNGERSGGDLALWIVFGVLYSIFNILWDLIMDWSLLKPRARYPLLRDEIVFPLGVYYLFIVVDVIGRCAWIVYLLPGLASTTLRSFLTALIEMIRRACWNNLRVENEQIGNTDSFKIIRDLPLPYIQKHKADEDEEDDMHKEGIFGSVRMRMVGRKKADAAPHHVDARESEGEIHTPSHQTGRSMSQTVMDTLRDKLVPDAKGPIDERAATKGRTGRDYEPRDFDSDSGSDDVATSNGDHTGGTSAAHD